MNRQRMRATALVMLLLATLALGWPSLFAAPLRVQWRGRLELTGQAGEGYYALGQVLAIMAHEKDTEARRVLSTLEGRQVQITIEEVSGDE